MTTLKTIVQQTRRMGIEVAERVMVQVRFCSHFSFSRSPLHVVVTSPPTPSPLTQLSPYYHQGQRKIVGVLGSHVRRRGYFYLIVQKG